MSTLNSTFQSQVDSAIQNLDTVSVNINYSNMSKSVLDQKFDLNISDEMLSAMSDLFISLSGTELKADQVNLYDFSGYVLQAQIANATTSANQYHVAVGCQKRYVHYLHWKTQSKYTHSNRLTSAEHLQLKPYQSS